MNSNFKSPGVYKSEKDLSTMLSRRSNLRIRELNQNGSQGTPNPPSPKPVFLWILDSGFWDDNRFWYDNKNWKD